MTTNAERQAAHRAKSKELLIGIQQELAEKTAENQKLHEKIVRLEKKITDQASKSAKTVADLEKRLLNALENSKK